MLNEWFALVIFQSLDKQNHHAILIYLCVSSKFDLLQQFIKACIKIIGNSAMMKGGGEGGKRNVCSCNPPVVALLKGETLCDKVNVREKGKIFL